MQTLFGKADDGCWVEGRGRVQRLLHDACGEARHQRFVLRLPGGQTVLVAHNVEVGSRVPLGLGDRIAFRGLYEWTTAGGTVHWTHDDPLEGDERGFIRWRGREFR